MSHIATIEIIVKDLDSLELACTELGLELMRNQHTYKWYGRAVGRTADASDGLCEHAIRVKGNDRAYEIGLVRKADGSGYELRWDDYNSGYGLVEKVGAKAGKLIQGYAVEVAVRAAKRAGFRVVKKVTRTDGSVAITTTR